jgi:predicted SprT family Zn-dependent metalloprotease
VTEVVHPITQRKTDLWAIYDELNKQFFEGYLVEPMLQWNSRLSSSAGRFIPGVRRGPWSRPALIEIATYLRNQPNAYDVIKDTMGHEMIHYWLWIRRRPYGHTAEFYEQMRKMGVSRYNTVGERRPYKHMYVCGHCRKDYPSRRTLGIRACGVCCERYNGGRFDRRFVLVYEGAYGEVIGMRQETLVLEGGAQCLGENPGASENP